jgi:prepilin-type N-terminal cleavage/methylation domain-containing protein
VSKHANGFTLLEIVVVVAIIGVIALCAVPSFANYRRRASIIAAADELRGIFRLVRSRAIARNRNAGVKFTQTNKGEWQYTIYDDGNGDGVRNADINSGVDRRVSGPSIVMPSFHLATIGLLPIVVKDPDGDKLQPTASAVQFGRSTIASFSPTGSGTPGSIYLIDGAGQLFCARVYGPSGKVRLLRWNPVPGKWAEP